MIKSETILCNVDEIYPTIEKPVLAKLNGTNTTVIFTAPSVGTVIAWGGQYYLGNHRQDWDNINNKEIWTVLPKGSQVILTVG